MKILLRRMHSFSRQTLLTKQSVNNSRHNTQIHFSKKKKKKEQEEERKHKKTQTKQGKTDGQMQPNTAIINTKAQVCVTIFCHELLNEEI